MSAPIRRLAAAAALIVLLFAYPGAAAATITGGCTGTGNATSGSVDLTTSATWHLMKADVAGGFGMGPTAHSATVSASALGLSIPIASGTSKSGDSQGSVSGLSVSLFAALGARFFVSGSADNGCAGEIEIIIDDVDPLYTVLGGGGAALGVLGGLLVLRTMRGGKGFFKRILDALYGAIGGAGAALALEQMGTLDPRTFLGLLIVLGAAVFGFATCGLLGGGKKKPVPTPTPAPPPPPPPPPPPDPAPMPDPGPTEPGPTTGAPDPGPGGVEGGGSAI